MTVVEFSAGLEKIKNNIYNKHILLKHFKSLQFYVNICYLLLCHSRGTNY